MKLSEVIEIRTVDGFKIVVMDELREKYPDKFNESGAMDYKWFEADVRPNNFIYVRDDVNSISFTLQKAGINGCQVDSIIEAAKAIVEGFDKKFPCEENKVAISALGAAVRALQDRKANRELRNLEGTSQS